MFEFLSRGRGKSDKTDPGPSTMVETVQANSTQRDMARLTLHHILKHHGIPGHWIAGELVPLHIPGEGEATLLQLEIMHWHDSLVLHAPALQQELLNGLRRFDPATGAVRYLFSWRFSPECGCPHTQLPDPDFWRTAPVVLATAVATAPPVPTAEPLAAPLTAASIPFDLPLRDDDDDDHGFAATEIHEVRD